MPGSSLKFSVSNYYLNAAPAATSLVSCMMGQKPPLTMPKHPIEYLNNGWIRRHESSADEIAHLLAIVDRDIGQIQTPGLDCQWRFDIAFNSTLQSATVALAAAGFQAERKNKHMRTIECLAFTAGIDKKKVTLLDRCRRKRHTVVYDQVGAISDHEADEMIALAKWLRMQVDERIREEHADLLP